MPQGCQMERVVMKFVPSQKTSLQRFNLNISCQNVDNGVVRSGGTSSSWGIKDSSLQERGEQEPNRGMRGLADTHTDAKIR